MERKWASTMAAFAMGLVDTIAYKGSLKQHVSFMTGNMQKVAGKNYAILQNFIAMKRGKKQTRKHAPRAFRVRHNKAKMDSYMIAYLWANYLVGAIIGAEVATKEWFGYAQWTLMIPATSLDRDFCQRR